jgi:hypothetical protein
MLAAVAREVAVVAIDHRGARTHEAREIEGRDAGTKREGREGVPEIVDSAEWIDASGTLRWSPLIGRKW